MRDEYDFTPEQLRNGVRGKYAARVAEGIIISSDSSASADSSAPADEEEHDPADALSVLENLTGTVEAPADWAAEHDHYLYKAPKRMDHKP